MKLCAKVVFLKTLHTGESIGYGRQFIAARESRIATLPLGYADGYIRAYATAAVCRSAVAARQSPAVSAWIRSWSM